MPDGSGRRRSRTPRVGVVSLLLGGDSYERAVAGGIVDAVNTRGGSATCFAVDGLGKDFGSFVGKDAVDAFVILSGPLMHAFGQEALATFCRERRHVPVVSVGAHLEGIAT